MVPQHEFYYVDDRKHVRALVHPPTAGSGKYLLCIIFYFVNIFLRMMQNIYFCRKSRYIPLLN